jgi:hypothetical protein
MAGRIATIGGVLAFIGVPSLLALLNGIDDQDGTSSPTLTPNTVATSNAPSTVATNAPKPAPPPQSKSPSPTRSTGLTINFSIAETYRPGKDKVYSCEEIQVFCVAVENSVYTLEGIEQRSGCHLSWRLYAGRELFEQGAIQYCGTDTIFLGRKPMYPGTYYLEADVELDDGTKGSSRYKFTASPRPSN